MNIFAVGPFIVSLLTISFGLIVYIRNKKTKLNKLFFLLSFSVFIWALGYSQMYNTKNNDSLALFWARIGYCGVVFIPVFVWHYIITFLNLKRKKVTVFVVYALGFIFLAISRTDSFLSSMYTKFFWGYYPKAGPLYIYFVMFFSLIFMRTVAILYTDLMIKRKEALSIQINRIKYLLFGFGIATTSIVDYVQNYGYEVYPWGYISALGWLLCIGWASFRYHLMDINIVLTRVGVFLLLYVFILGIPFWIGFRTESWLISTSFAVFFASLGPFIYNYLSHHAEDILFKEQRKYQKALRELSRSMTRMRDLGQLLKTIAFVVVDKVKVNSIAIYLKDEEYRCFKLKEFYPADKKSKFEGSIQPNSPLIDVLTKLKRPIIGEELRSENIMSLDAGLIAPLFIEDDLLGFLAVGSKPNNLIYTLEDILVFETLSYSTSLAIENCIFWKEIEDRHRKARLQEMDTYSYSLAHEIDNPMHIILNETLFMKKYLLKHIQDPKDLKDAESAINYTIEASQRVSGMVKAIREFGQKTTGELKPLKVEDVIESFHRLYHPQLKENRVVFEKDIATGLGYIRGEKPELMQVLVIFANNSLHAMKQLPAKKLFLKAELSSPDTVRITLSDNGYGIKSENLQIIFTPFTTTKASSEGTGMGLYNAKKIVERHKGKIWAESQGEGQGASLCFELPIARDVTEEELKKEDTKVKRLI